MELAKNDPDLKEKSFDEVETIEEDGDDGDIPPEYLGTAADKRDMITLGKKQVLRVGGSILKVQSSFNLILCSATSALSQC
jgi:hypothetical protein